MASQPNQISNSSKNEILTLPILEKETGLSVSEIERLTQNFERISEISMKYRFPQFRRHGNPSSRVHTDDTVFQNILQRLRSASKCLLSRKRVHIECGKRNPDTTDTDTFGIAQYRKQNIRKWSKIFPSDSFTTKQIELASSLPSPTTIKNSEENKNNSNNYSHCYICQTKIQSHPHSFYPKLCRPCGDFNFEQRNRTGNLVGKIALVTGGRIKIGYEAALKLLRCGATVIVTSRFPTDAAKRYSHELDFNTWSNRLHIYPLDLRFLQHVEQFCRHLNLTYPKLDILVQNAAQTVRRPVAFYKHLLEFETQASEYPELICYWDKVSPNQPQISSNTKESNLLSVFEGTGSIRTTVATANNIAKSVLSSQMMVHPEDIESCKDIEGFFPPNCYDDDHQQLDLRPVNSWILEADQVDTVELVEVHLINSISPFIILNKLTPLLKKSTVDGGLGWIILVSAMEGKFNRLKTSQHPHTNSAKAALNMLVRTSASYYREFGLLMNAVDTGWVTDEEPVPLKLRRETLFETPIDCVDGAARVLHPIFQTVNDNVRDYGRFFKDYFPSSW